MPRLNPRVLRHAHALHPSLSRLLPVCRDLSSAQNELRWLTEHAASISQKAISNNGQRDNIRSHLHKKSWSRDGYPNLNQSLLFESYIHRRARGEPLQYILGTEFFGALELRCRPGVLIPRTCTATAISRLTRQLHSPNLPPTLRILDLCTGSGCIPLHLHDEFYTRFPSSTTHLQVVGADISPAALTLARENLLLQITRQAKTYTGQTQRLRALQRMGFIHADVLAPDSEDGDLQPPSLQAALRSLSPHPSSSPAALTFDILTANPPYISPQTFRSKTARSVRTFEPQLALIPPAQNLSDDDQTVGDAFYTPILHAAEAVQARVVVLEVGDLEQGMRVVERALAGGEWEEVEIWRDEPDVLGQEEREQVVVQGRRVRVRGEGEGRTVVLWREGKEGLLISPQN